MTMPGDILEGKSKKLLTVFSEIWFIVGKEEIGIEEEFLLVVFFITFNTKNLNN